ncbi:hypothetical protein BMS3Abin16_00047 [archaeon BMS3Abin16]|nr:hypothetical protein BMS3Abin16_00047 [archaeon BMS3Abin16]
MRHAHRRVCKTGHSLPCRIGVKRAHRSVMACVHSCEKCSCLRASNLTHDHTVRPHSQSVFHKLIHIHFAFALYIRRLCFQPDPMRCRKLQFGCVFNCDYPLCVRDKRAETVERCSLPASASACNQDVSRLDTCALCNIPEVG